MNPENVSQVHIYPNPMAMVGHGIASKVDSVIVNGWWHLCALCWGNQHVLPMLVPNIQSEL